MRPDYGEIVRVLQLARVALHACLEECSSRCPPDDPYIVLIRRALRDLGEALTRINNARS
jgi:hypothetical protein